MIGRATRIFVVRRTGFTLIEFLAVIAVAMLIMFVLGYVMIDVLRVARLTRDRDMRVSAIDGLSKQLRADVRLAAACNPRQVEWDGVRSAAIELQLQSPPGELQKILYVLRRDQVERIADGSRAGAWAAPQLEFGHSIETAGNVDLMRLTYHELPSTSGVQRTPRRTEICVQLPGRRPSELPEPP